MPPSHLARPSALAAYAWIAAIAAAGAAGFFRVSPPRDLRPYANLRRVRISGTVLTGFTRRRMGDRFWLRVSATEGRLHPAVRVLAYLKKGDPNTATLRPGDRAVFEGRLRLPRWPRNPGGFDEREFLEKNGAVFVFHGAVVDRSGGSLLWSPWAAGESVHRSIHGYLARRFDAVDASILEGLLIGYKGTLPTPLSRAIQDAGTMHLLTPSGSKVTLLLLWTLWVCGAAGLGRGARIAAAGIAGGLYILVVGTAPPYTRAYLMFLAAAAGYACDRESGPFQWLILSAALTAVVDPRSIFSAGFQFSYLAMFGIVLVSARPPAVLGGAGRFGPVARAAAIGLIVQLMLWPAFAEFFGNGSLIGLFVNVVMIPASGVIALAGFGAWAADIAGLAPLEWPLRLALGGMVRSFRALCVGAADLPWAAIPLRPYSAAGLAAHYCFTASLTMAYQGRRALPAAAAGVVLAAAALWRPGPGESFEILVLSAKNGRAALVREPGSGPVLVDAGVAPSALRAAFRAEGVGLLDRVVLTGSGPESRRSIGRMSAEAVLVEERVGIPVEWKDGTRSFRLDPEGRWIVAEGGKVLYCIMAFPSKSAPPWCPARRSYYTGYEGAVRIVSHGEKIEIVAEKELHEVGRPFPQRG